MQISAVMPVHNEADVLDRVLRSVQYQTHPPEDLILVFDLCTDRSRRVARGQSQQELVVDYGNTGDAVRAGIRQARFGTIVLFDANTLVPPNYVEELLRVLGSTNADLVEWHGGLMVLTKNTIARFGPPSSKALWTLELFLRVKAGGGKIVHLDGPYLRLKASPLHRNFRYGLDYADLSWQHGLAPFFRIGTKSGWVQDILGTAGVFAGHLRRRRLIPAVRKLLANSWRRVSPLDET
jgi:glycosyltransferase involved in cell wall biosynthesis